MKVKDTVSIRQAIARLCISRLPVLTSALEALSDYDGGQMEETNILQEIRRECRKISELTKF